MRAMKGIKVLMCLETSPEVMPFDLICVFSWSSVSFKLHLASHLASVIVLVIFLSWI